jgi:hypothetical protein
MTGAAVAGFFAQGFEAVAGHAGCHRHGAFSSRRLKSH